MYNIEIDIYIQPASQSNMFLSPYWIKFSEFASATERILKKYFIDNMILELKPDKILLEKHDNLSIGIHTTATYINNETKLDAQDIEFIKNEIREQLTHIIIKFFTDQSGITYVNVRIEEDKSDLNIRIIEEPLTSLNLISTMTSLTHLHTKCWLISKKRFADAIEYALGYSSHYAEEAHLLITKLSYNSPADIRLNVNADISSQGIAEALRIAIDAIAQAPFRREEAKLANQAQILEMKMKEQEAQSTIADNEQSRQIASQKADLEKQEMQLQLEARKIELEVKRLELQEKRLEIEKRRIDYALETANKMVQVLSPYADEGTKEMLLRTLIPDLLQLGNSKGLESILPSPKIADDTTD